MISKEDSINIYSFDPVFDNGSRILILGTMASPVSLKAGMYYGHPQNAFWRILCSLTEEPFIESKEARYALLLRHGVALWDTIYSCERIGAADTAIKNVIPNRIGIITQSCPLLQAVFLNGSLAYSLYKRYQANDVKLPYYKLPSTSPANAKGGFKAKRAAWSIIKPYLTF